MLKKAMISQPMAGKSQSEIEQTKAKAVTALKNSGHEIVNTLFTEEWYSEDKMEERGVVQIPVCFLSKSIEGMSRCHTVYFCKGWEDARGCRIEHDIAVAYGLDVMYEKDSLDEEYNQVTPGSDGSNYIARKHSPSSVSY